MVRHGGYFAARRGNCCGAVNGAAISFTESRALFSSASPSRFTCMLVSRAFSSSSSVRVSATTECDLAIFLTPRRMPRSPCPARSSSRRILMTPDPGSRSVAKPRRARALRNASITVRNRPSRCPICNSSATSASGMESPRPASLNRSSNRRTSGPVGIPPMNSFAAVMSFSLLVFPLPCLAVPGRAPPGQAEPCLTEPP